MKTIVKGTVLCFAGIGLLCMIEQSAKEAGGIYDVMLPEAVIIKDINRSKREITVEMVDQDNIYVHEEDENPYGKDKVVLEYSYEKDFYVSDLEISDEVVFRHFYNTPYKIESIKKNE